MKVRLIGKNPEALTRRIANEGDFIVHDANEADLIIHDSAENFRFDFRGKGRTVAGGYRLPNALLDGLEIKVKHGPCLPTHFFARWYDEFGWGKQTILGVPVFGLMNEDLGPQVNVLTGARFIKSQVSDEVFSKPEIEVVFKEWRHRGFVSFIYNGQDLVAIETGLPFLSFFNLLEHITGKLSSWFCSPNKLHEAWSLASLVSRHPFPIAQKTDDSLVRVEGLTPEIEKHFSMFGNRVIRRATYSEDTEIGVATGWGSRLWDAEKWVLETCRRIELPGKQYRTDVSQAVKKRYGELQNHGNQPFLAT